MENYEKGDICPLALAIAAVISDRLMRALKPRHLRMSSGIPIWLFEDILVVAHAAIIIS
jgi:hypothetical protein